MSVRCIFINLPGDKGVQTTFLHAIASLPDGVLLSAFRGNNLVATAANDDNDAPAAVTYTLLVPQSGVQFVLDALLSCGIGDLSRRPGTEISIVAGTDASICSGAPTPALPPALPAARDPFVQPPDPQPTTKHMEPPSGQSTYQAARVTSRMLADSQHEEQVVQALSDVGSRLTCQEVWVRVRSGAEPSLDYFLFIVFAGLIAVTGLIADSVVSVVASMIVSPLMGPILAFTFGPTIHDSRLSLLGLRSELMGLLLCLAIGFFSGLITIAIGPLSLVKEITGRTQVAALIPSLVVGLASGLGVALSVSVDAVNSLVGIAISASLLPPMVNCGLLLAAACVPSRVLTLEGAAVTAVDMLRGAGISFSIVAINILAIFVAGYLLFLLQGVVSPVVRSRVRILAAAAAARKSRRRRATRQSSANGRAVLPLDLQALGIHDGHRRQTRARAPSEAEALQAVAKSVARTVERVDAKHGSIGRFQAITAPSVEASVSEIDLPPAVNECGPCADTGFDAEHDNPEFDDNIEAAISRLLMNHSVTIGRGLGSERQVPSLTEEDRLTIARYLRQVG